MKTILITGGCGFIGTNASKYYLDKGYRVIAFDNLSRVGARENLDWLRGLHGDFVFIAKADLRDAALILEVIKEYEPDYILHLAAQVTMVNSLVNPREDFEINALGTFNVLEAMRKAGCKSPAIYASTNKVMGQLSDIPLIEKELRYDYQCITGINETYPLDFHGPYGCSKGCGDQYFLDYARVFGLNTVVFRQSGIYGHHQFGIEEQGWLAWFCNSLLFDKPVTIFGDGKQVRDVLYVADLIRAYELALNNIEKTRGKAYNIGGGPLNTLSIWELVNLLDILNEKNNRWSFKYGPWRQGDQKVYISDVSRAAKDFLWSPVITPDEGVKKLYNWINENRSIVAKAGVFE